MLKERMPNLQFRDIQGLWESGKQAHDSACSKHACSTAKPVGYKLMCKFYGIQLQRLLADEGYDYVMRLDDDGFIRQPLPMNMFELMEMKGFVYGYRRVQWGLHDLADRTLIPATLEYIQSRKLDIACDPSDVNTQHFYNNFYITKLSFWTRLEVQAYLQYLDEHGGIWRYGWGDSLIMAAAVKMFALPHEIVQLVGIDYEHGSHHLRIAPDNADWRFRKDMANIPHSSYLCSARVVDLREDASRMKGIRGTGCQYAITPVLVPENALCTANRVYNTCVLVEPKTPDPIISALCDHDNLLTSEQLDVMRYCAAVRMQGNAVTLGTVELHDMSCSIVFATLSDVATDSRLRRLQHTAAANGIELQVVVASGKLGKGDSGGKVSALTDFFASLSPDQLVIMTDGFDVAYFASPAEIFQRYREMGGGIIFAADSSFHMTDVYTTSSDRTHAKRQYKQWAEKNGIRSPYMYLQSGTVMGSAGQLLEFYQQAMRWASSSAHPWQSKSEQSLLSAYFIAQGHKRHPHVKLDVCHQLFTVTFQNLHYLSITNRKVVHRLTASNPLVVHTPGPDSAQSVLDSLVGVMYGSATGALL